MFGTVLIAIGVSLWVRWIGMLIAGHQSLTFQILEKMSSTVEKENLESSMNVGAEEMGKNNVATRLDQFQWIAGLIIVIIGIVLLFN